MGIVSVGTGPFDVADLLVLRPSGLPLLIEVKTRKSGRRPGGLSQHQAAARDYCRNSHYGWATVWAFGEVRREPIKTPKGEVAFRLQPPADLRVRGASTADEELVVKALESEKASKCLAGQP